MNEELNSEVQEPVETQEAPEAEVPETPEAGEVVETPEAGEAKAKKSAQQRINEITRARHDAEREAAYWRGKAEAAASAAPVTTKQEVAAPTQRPDLSNFQDYNSYVEALTDWKTEVKIQEVLQQSKAQENQDRQTQQVQSIAQEWATRQDEARKTLEDYDEVLGSANINVSPAVTDILLTSDKGPVVAYHLAKNPAIVEKLNAMSPLKAAREIGRLEATMEAAPSITSKAAPAPATVTKTATTSSSDLGRMSMEQYKAARAKQGARWARR
jgi:hypothetical protein